MDSKRVNTIKPAANNLIEEQLINIRGAGATTRRIRLFAQRELEQIKKMRADVEQYQREITTKANSQAQQLILHARLAVQKEVGEIKRKANEELQKAMADFDQKTNDRLEQGIAEFKQRLGEELQQEMADLKQKVSEELEKVLADIRVVRITANEELKAQRKLTDAARIHALSFELQDEDKQKSGHVKQAIEL
jgi:F0F1-type ATP synthase membrane subunit b/b'